MQKPPAPVETGTPPKKARIINLPSEPIQVKITFARSDGKKLQLISLTTTLQPAEVTDDGKGNTIVTCLFQHAVIIDHTEYDQLRMYYRLGKKRPRVWKLCGMDSRMVTAKDRRISIPIRLLETL
jgi:hypothetical protein